MLCLVPGVSRHVTSLWEKHTGAWALQPVGAPWACNPCSRPPCSGGLGAPLCCCHPESLNWQGALHFCFAQGPVNYVARVIPRPSQKLQQQGGYSYAPTGVGSGTCYSGVTKTGFCPGPDLSSSLLTSQSTVPPVMARLPSRPLHGRGTGREQQCPLPDSLSPPFFLPPQGPSFLSGLQAGV